MNKKVDLTQLSKLQKVAVQAVDGVIQLCSVAGSGKTRVLTHRIAYMVNELKIDPASILVATFTKKASDEMAERLGKLMFKKNIEKLLIGTFHSIGNKILRNEYRRMNHPMKDAQLLNGAPIKWLIKQILVDMHIQITDGYNENVFAAKINEYKLNLITPEQLVANVLIGDASEHEKNLIRVYEEYEKRKTRARQIDYNDMIYQTYFMLLENPDILKRYQNQIKYILVDEAQDNNTAQYELIKMLAEPERNIFIVGDDDQSIYKFRGARPEEFINFRNDYPELWTIYLQDNYRSQSAILEAANNLIAHNEVRIYKKLNAASKLKTEAPIYFQGNDEDEEAEKLAKYIEEEKTNGRSYNDIAILYRTNAQSRAIEDNLVSNGIPYVIYNSISFYDRAEIKDLIAYLRLAYNTKDDEAFERIINVPSRYLGKVFLEDLKVVAKLRKISLYEALNYAAEPNRSGYNIKNFKTQIEHIKNEIKNISRAYLNVSYIIKVIRGIVNYDNYLRKENGNDEDNIRLENVESLTKAGSKFETVEKFLDYIEIVTNAKNDKNIPTVKLMTIHKSKGLEFPVVFIAGMVDGLLPHAYALKENDITEERRLGYVAITRSMEKLYVSSPLSYNNNIMASSIFIEESGLNKYLVNDDNVTKELEQEA